MPDKAKKICMASFRLLHSLLKKAMGQNLEKYDTSSRSENDTRAEDADIKSVNEKEPRAEFACQVDVNNVLSKPVTPYYLLKVQEYVLAKPHHVIAPRTSRNSQEELYGSNDMAHNHYLEEARKKTQERNRNSKSSVKHTTSLQNTTNGTRQKPKSNNQTSRSLPVFKSSCRMSNEKEVPISEGSPITRTERVHETYMNVSQEIRDQLNAETEAVQIILTGIDNDIYSTVDACPNACEM
nr:hypothetical protein [Tanacetum cinerariifolium]